jgi:hypothetical protein
LLAREQWPGIDADQSNLSANNPHEDHRFGPHQPTRGSQTGLVAWIECRAGIDTQCLSLFSFVVLGSFGQDVVWWVARHRRPATSYRNSS